MTLANMLFSTSADATQPAGEWFRICCTPDPFTGERINIGVGVRDPAGALQVRVADDPHRLSCLYGDEGAENILFIAEVTAEALLADQAPPTDQVQLGPAMPFFHCSTDEALANFFAQQVPIAAALRDKTPRTSLPTETVLKTVYELLKHKAPERCDHIIPQLGRTVIQHRDRQRAVRVALQPPGQLGALESAGFRSAQSVRMHLQDAWLDLEAAAEFKGIRDLAFFIARPQTDEKAWLDLIDDAIDRVVWRLPTRCRIEIDDDLDHLSDKILDWAA